MEFVYTLCTRETWAQLSLEYCLWTSGFAVAVEKLVKWICLL